MQGVRWYARRGDIKRLFDADQHVESTWTFESPIYIGEMEDFVGAPEAGYGALWVKAEAGDPNTLWFTDDAGTDWQLAGAGAGGDHFLSVYIQEAIAARADELAYGQLWIKTVPSSGMPLVANSLWYTDEAGVDVAIMGDASPELSTTLTCLNGVDIEGGINLDTGVLSLKAVASPSSAVGRGAVYTSTIAGVTQLFYKASNGTETQLTF